MKDSRSYERPARPLRILLVTLLLVGLTVIALGAIDHSHVHPREHDAVSTQFVDSMAAPTADAPAERGLFETDGVCLAVVIVALVLLTFLQALLAHAAGSSAPVRSRPHSSGRPLPASVSLAPDLTVLAVCRQ